MKFLLKIAVSFLSVGIGFPVFISAQTGSETYQLKENIRRLAQQPNYQSDTAYANAITDLAYLYAYTYPDSALLIVKGNAERCRASGYKKGEVKTYIVTGDAFQTKGLYNKAIENYKTSYALAKDIHYNDELPLILNRIGMIDLNQGNYPEALSKFYQSLKAAETFRNNALTGAALNNIAIVYFYQGNFSEAENAYRQRLAFAQKTLDSSSMSFAYNGLGEVNLQQKKPAEALHNLTLAYNLALQVNDEAMLLTISLSTAEAYYELDSLQKSISLFDTALRLSKQMDNGTFICNALIGLAKARYKQGLLKEALVNGRDGLQKAEKIGQVQLMRDANEIVSTIYEALHDGNNALKYFRAYKIYSDSMTNLASERAAATEKAGYEFSKKETEFEQKALQQRWIIFSAFAALLAICIIAFIINKNRKRLNHSNKILHHKNLLIEAEKLKAEETLEKLKETQSQLIQSEKMASLGELMAGIAHEIQNPLNFVNNFSEVSNELIDELQDERSKVTGERNEETEDEILNDIKQNLEKINHHGKRADSIVKGMLQHSRQTKGVKEPTDINALCDEYLRLSYHGLRAKNKSFNAGFETDFDKTIGKINIVPQDMGRVLLNLFNNAFYAVSKPPSLKGEQYKPLITVTTKKIKVANNNAAANSPLGDGGIEITVSDNGNGIPQNVIDKIFQPFFTTKPTGEGTGLSLSLAYDIITKEHNGTIKTESKEGEGTTFIIQLPMK